MKQHHKSIAAGTAVCAITLLSGLTAAPSHALPQDGAVVGGSAAISQPNPTTMNINQTSGTAIINWSGYSIGANESVHYIQPGSSSIALNRVTGVDPSYLYGLLSGNGQVWVINPNGLLVGPGATVQTGSFLASTMNITNENFLSGKQLFTNTPGSQGSIINRGTISAANGGYVVLAAPSVTNSGKIVANMGTVHLASGDAVTLSLDNGSLINVAVNGDIAANSLGVTNSGVITAAGGKVVMTARVAGDIMKNIVNNSGIIEAQSIGERNGEITLDGGDYGISANSGTLDASGRKSGESGGTIKIVGDRVGLFAGSAIDASGAAGGGTVLIGGDFHGAGPEKNASMTYVDTDAAIKADALVSGDGGKVAVWSDDATRFYGEISAKGGVQGGDGGFAEVSGKRNLIYAGNVNLGAPKGVTGTLLLDPDDITIIHADVIGSDTANNIPLDAPFINWDSTATPSNISDFTINAQLATPANVTVQTSTGSISSDPGVVIDLNSKILTLDSAKDITLGGTYNDTGASGTLALKIGQRVSGGTLSTIPGAATINAHTVDVTGGSGSDTIDVGGFGGAVSIHDTIGGDTLTGNSTHTTLIGSNAGSVFTISGPNAGTLNGSTTFSGITTLTGGSNADTFTLGAGTTTFTGSIAGGGGADTLAATDGSNSWQVTGANAGTLNGTTAFSGITNLAGGAGDDAFTLDVPAFSGSIAGGGGADTLAATDGSNSWRVTGANDGTLNTTTTFSGITNLAGGSVADTFLLDADVPTFNGTITGGGGTDTLHAGNGTNTWQTTGTNSGTLNESTLFSGITNLAGGSGGDTTTIGIPGFIGTITGGGGSDTLLAANGTNTWQATGSNSGTLNGSTLFSGITNLAGGSGADTLTGRNVSNVWSITGTKAATLDGMNATGMDALIGGSGTDIFRLGTGVLTFNGSITGDGISDTLAATNGTNSWQVTGANAGTMNGSTLFSGITNLSGGTGADTFRLAADIPAFSGGVTGGGGSDTLAATNGTNSWQVTGANAGTLNGSTLFSGITNLSGGSDTDTLTGQNSANTTGWSVTGANAVTLSGMNATGMDGLAGGTGKDIFTLAEGVPTFNGSITGGGSDTLAAVAGTNNWQVTGANAGTLNGTTTFSGITSLSGGTGADTFRLAADIPTFSGGVTGGGGSDTLAATNGTNSWQVTGANAGTLNGTTTFSGITNLSGGADADTLTGRDTANDWRIIGPAAATVDAMSANGMDALVGGMNADTFTLGTGVSTFAGPISGGGGGGSDTLAATNGTNSWQVTGANAGTLNGTTLFSGITNLNGGSDADTFTLDSGISSFNGLIAGGGGTDLLAVTDGTNSWRHSGANAGTLNTTTVFSGISNLSGGAGTDTLTGTAQTYTLDDSIVDKGSNGSENWTSMESLTDTAAGIFRFGTAGGVSGNITASGGILDYAGHTPDVQINLATKTATGIGSAWNGIANISGSNGNSDTIGGSNTTYNLTEPHAGTSGGVSWSSFEKVADIGTGTIATTGGQTYTLTGANSGNVATLLPGGYTGIGSLFDSGASTFRFAAGGAVTGSITATGGTLDYSAGMAGPVAVELAAKKSSGIGGTWSGITTMVGSGASDTIGGADATYNLTAAGVGTSGGVSWSSFEKVADSGTGTIAATGGQTYNLTGANSGNVATLLPGGYTGIGTLTDSGAGNFTFGPAGGVSGNINAAGGTLDYTARTAAVNVHLADNTGSGIGGVWNGITTMIGGGASDTLGGSNATYNLTGADAGNSGAVSWTSFENLHDTAAGIFRFADAGGVSGGITATGGMLDYSALAGPVTVDLTAKSGPGIGTNWNGITTLAGSSNGSDTIAGSGQTFNLTDLDAGNNGDTSWSSFENIDGAGGSNSYSGAAGSALSGAIIDSGSDATVQGSIQSGGGQSYAGPVTLAGATTLTSSGSGAITFGSTVASDDTPRDLTVGTDGAITFAGAVGAAALNSLTINSGGTTTITGGSVTTSGAAGQTYNNAVLLGGDTLLNAGPGAIVEGSSGSMTAAGLLTTRSGSGQNLVGNGTNSVAAFNAANSTSGDINLANTSPLLTITGINQSGGGVTITNSGAITSSGPLAVSGTTSINAAGQPITLTDSENDFGGAVTVVGAATSLTDKNDLTADLNTTGPTTLEVGGGLTLSGTSTDAVLATAGDKVTLSDPTASTLSVTGDTIVGTMNNRTPLDLTTTSTQEPITVNLTGTLPFLTTTGDVKTQIRSLGLYNGAVVMGSELDHYNATIDSRAATTDLALNAERFGTMGMLAHSDDFFNTAPMESHIDSRGAFILPEEEPTLINF
ncbi:MAG: filamentous hemagglutinin N-terminal domain-containing protein [Desulfuromonadaceae bacterium]|nr:filamentous hemagglutinin N-terminal domain-containing protein [Desulfuromonadaceae bacterium]